MIKIGINGIGRIGKYVLKFLISKNIKPEWINDSAGNIEIHRHLLEFDTVHGKWDANFSNNATTISIDEKKLLFTNYSKIEELKLNLAKDKIPQPTSPSDFQKFKKRWEINATKYSFAVGLAYGARAMLPVQAESFINLLLFVLSKPEIKKR